MGAWIETLQQLKNESLHNVAPYVGAWIETFVYVGSPLKLKSHPTWVRGLKQNEGSRLDNANKSHPTWVRGLKHAWCTCHDGQLSVAPYVGAWIETCDYVELTSTGFSRTLRGCVD